MCIFPASGRKHADAIELCDRDTSTWCQDVFHAIDGKDDFRQCRAHRGDSRTWRPNANAYQLPGVETFVHSLPFFSNIGKIAIIINRAGDKGVEHRDIGGQDDLVSEFVWIRTHSSKKIFFVKDPVTHEKVYAPLGPCVGWFDDHLLHNIDTIDEDNQWSIRVDGRFTPEFRTLLVEQGIFGTQKHPIPEDQGLGLRGVLAAQQNGVCFLLRENERELSSEEEEEEEEEKEEEQEEQEKMVV